MIQMIETFETIDRFLKQTLLDWNKSNQLKMTYKRGTVKLFTFSSEVDAPNIRSCGPKIFSCVPKILAVHLKIYIWLHKCSETQIQTLNPAKIMTFAAFWDHSQWKYHA